MLKIRPQRSNDHSNKKQNVQENLTFKVFLIVFFSRDEVTILLLLCRIIIQKLCTLSMYITILYRMSTCYPVLNGEIVKVLPNCVLLSSPSVYIVQYSV